MDELFILMCEKAVELQELDKLEPLEEDDYPGNIVGDVLYLWNTHYYVKDMSNPIFMPTIRELRNRTGLRWEVFDYRCAIMMGCDMNKLADITPDNYVLYEEYTKEQAAIRVVMKDKYNKVWNGKDWIKC